MIFSYVQQYIDGRTDATRIPGEGQMRDYVKEMLADLHKSHKVREQQLSQAAQNYKSQLKDVVTKQEQLLIAYR